MFPTVTVDVGTTSVKLTMFDDAGQQLVGTRHPTPTTTDAWGEIYDLDALTGQVDRFIADLSPAVRASVRRIAFTGVGESGGLVRPDLSLASPMILWHDHRGAGALSALGEAGRDRVYRVTGLPLNANYGLSKVAWAVAHAGDAGAGAVWVHVVEYLAALLTGRRASEYSLASRTMALDLTTRSWSTPVCELFGVDVSVFPPIHASTDGDPIAAHAAARLGLPDTVVVHVAGHDHMVGAVGAGLRTGELLNSTGTTEGLLFLRARPALDDASAHAKLANGIDCTGDQYTLFASIPTGGSAFATLRGLLDVSAAQLTAHIESAHARYVAGMVDLDDIPLVLPRFRGSPPPAKRKADRGVISGLRTDTTLEDVVFGCFLGMVLQFRDVLELFPDPPTSVKVIGPATVNPLWLQLKADLLDIPLDISGLAEVVSVGAQAIASGSSRSWDDANNRRVLPDAARGARLRQWSASIAPEWEYLKGIPS